MFVVVVMILAVLVMMAMVVMFCWAVDVGVVGCAPGQERKIVAVTVPMPLSLSGWSMEVSPRSYGDPAAERDQGETGGRVDEMTEAHGDGDARDPNHRRDDQGREDMSSARL